MKRTVILVLILLVLIFSFSYSKISIYSAKTDKPISFVSVSRLNSVSHTDYYGNLSFFRTALPEKIKLSRIGYREKIAQLPFALFFSSKKFLLDTANYTEVQSEILDSLKKATSYEYSYHLTVSGKSNNNQAITAKFNNGNFFFENSSDFTNAHIKVWYINGEMYESKNGGSPIGPLNEQEKQALSQQSIVFLPITDLVSSIFPLETPLKIRDENNTLSFTWNNENMEIKVSEENYPGLINLDSNDIENNTTYKLILKIENVNGKVKIEK